MNLLDSVGPTLLVLPRRKYDAEGLDHPNLVFLKEVRGYVRVPIHGVDLAWPHLLEHKDGEPG